MINIQLRCIYTCVRLQAATPGQLGRIVNKVMSFDQTKKLRKKESQSGKHVAQPNPIISYGPPGTKKAYTHKNRRVTVLNKVFMKYISDLMATGEVAPNLLGKGIEISHVKVSPDFQLVNVYWFAQSETDANESTEKILKQAAGKLQHELSGLRVIGVVPPIQFVKNKHHTSIKDVENLLSEVDFGEDYVPTAYITRKDIPVLKTSLPSELKAKISKLENESHEEGVEEEEGYYEIRVPEMRQDVLGVNYTGIMKRIKHTLSKTKIAENHRLNISEEPEPQMSNEDLSEMLSSRKNNIVFDEFLKTRLADQKRKQRALSLQETKLLEEEEWIVRMEGDNNVEDLQLEEEYRDEYKDIEKY